MQPSDKRRLLASIHDVSPRFEREVLALHERLAGHLGGSCLAMLVVPDHWGSSPISAAPAFRARLREWAESGVEMFVHGWFHRDDGPRTGFKARHMTAGEGEFSSLARAEALDRMRRGRAIVEDAIGMPAAGFVAPAWLYSKDSLDALGEAGFDLAEDHMAVWRPSDGRRLARGPVITWASRSPARIASSLTFAAIAPYLLQPLPIVRVAVHPGDNGVPSLLRSIDHVMTTLLATGRAPGRYRDLLPLA